MAQFREVFSHTPIKRTSTHDLNAVSTQDAKIVKRVKFSEELSHHCIQSSSESAPHRLHYTHADYLRFKFSAVEEIRQLKLKYQDFTTKQVISLLYQPTPEKSKESLTSRDDSSNPLARRNLIIIPGSTITQTIGNGTTAIIHTALFLFRNKSNGVKAIESTVTKSVIEAI